MWAKLENGVSHCPAKREHIKQWQTRTDLKAPGVAPSVCWRLVGICGGKHLHGKESVDLEIAPGKRVTNYRMLRLAQKNREATGMARRGEGTSLQGEGNTNAAKKRGM